MATKQEIINQLSQCGGLSYQWWIRLLDSIYFDGDISDFLIDIPSTNILPQNVTSFKEIAIVGSGTYTQSGATPLVVPDGSIAVISKNRGSSTWYISRTLPIPMQDLSPYLKIADLQNDILDYTPYIMNNTVVTTIGSIGTHATNYAGAKSIVNMPIPEGTWTLGGYVVNAGKNFAIVNSAGEVKAGSIKDLGSSKLTFEITNDGFNMIRVMFKSMNASEPNDDGWLNKMTIARGTEYIPNYVSKIKNLPIYAQGLISGNSVPDPITALNAVNLNYLKTFGILTSDLTVVPSSNLATQEDNITIIPNKYIGNNGLIINGQYWKMYKFYPLRNGLNPGDPFVIGGFTINTAGYSSWFEGDVLKTYNGSYQNTDLPKNFVVPMDATNNTILYFDIARPVDIDNFINLTINKGTTLLPYENPFGKITKIKGRDVGGSGGTSIVSKFEDLVDVPEYVGNANKGLKIKSTEDGIETFDPVEQNTDVAFSKVSSPLGDFETLVMNNIPIWDETGTPPIDSGFAYLFPDGNGNYFQKFKG